MIVLVLAAGYATRLYPLTIDNPKPLLPIGPKALIEHIFEKISTLSGVTRCYIVTNEKFFGKFNAWADKFSFRVPIEIINDETTTNETRLGAIKDIDFVIKKKGITDDLLVIGGDNLFEFDLKAFTAFAAARSPDSSVAVFDIGDLGKAKLYGVVKAGAGGRVAGFQEKPDLPESTLISTCVYYFSGARLGLVSEFLMSGNKSDAPGNYIKWLSENHKIYAFPFKEKWYDIGDMKSYEEANNEYNARYKNRKENIE